MNKETTIRLIMTLIFVPLTGVSVAFYNVANFGVDPFTMLVQGLHKQLSSFISYGLTYILISVIEIIAIFFISKSKIGVGTLINLFLLGYIVDYSSRALRYVVGDLCDNMIVRIVFLAIGVLLMGFCLAFYFTSDMGVSTHDAVSLIAAEKQNKIKFSTLRVLDDLLCVVLGLILGGKFGVGTLAAAFLCGPLVSFFRKHVSDPIRYGKAKE